MARTLYSSAYPH
ncbi:hypothetical protein YPPY63_2593, partial [Yersinia pestis PY-63]